MDPPFVGRHAEQEQLLGLLAAVVSGHSSVVILSGPAGIGKSRLVTGLLAQAAELADVSHSTRCSAFDASPTDALHRLRRRAGGPPTPAPASAADPAPAATSLDDRSLIGATIEELLSGWSQPAVVTIDDVHWASPLVLDFVELLAVETGNDRRRPVLLILITRPLPPDHPTVARLTRVEGDIRVTRIDLGPIDESADTDLIRAVAPGASTTLINYVRRAAGGNPLRTIASLELLRGRHLPAGLTSWDRRGWSTLVHDLDPADPLAQWLDGIPESVRQACAGVAFVGDEATAELVAIALGLDDVDAIAGYLEQAVTEHVLASAADRFWFRHDLYRDHFERSLPLARRRRGHRRLARWLLDQPPPRSRTTSIQLCRHILEAGPELLSDPLAVASLEEGAEAAAAARAWPDAARFFEAHLEARPGPLPEPGREADLLLRVGTAHYYNADPDSAMTRLEQAVATAPDSDDELLAAALVPLMRLRTGRERASMSRPADLPALDHFLSTPRRSPARAAVVQVRSESLIAAGELEEGVALALEAYELAQVNDEQLVMAFAAAARGLASLVRGAPTEALPWYARGLAAARRGNDWFAEDTIRCRAAFAHLMSGRVRRAGALADEMEQVTDRARGFTNLGLARVTQGIVAYLSGDFAAARRKLAGAASAGRRSGYGAMPLLVIPSQVLIDLAVDDTAAAVDRLAAAPPSVAAALTDLINRGRSAPRLERPRRTTELGVGLLAAGILATDNPCGGDLDELGGIIELLETVIGTGLELSTTIPVSTRRALGRALATVGRLDQAIDHLAEAERWCRDEGCHTELSLTLLEAALTNMRRGGEEEAVGQALEADVLARRLGMPVTAAAARRLHRRRRPQNDSGRQLTILVSDIAGSTLVGQRLGDRAYFELVMEHHALVRQLLGAHGGTEFSEGGDSLLAWFDSPGAAVACGFGIQAGAARRRRSGSLLETKVGVAQGRPFFSRGRPYGSVVNRASRLAAFAPVNGIALDEDTMADVEIDPVDLRTTAVDLRGIGRETVGIITGGAGPS